MLQVLGLSVAEQELYERLVAGPPRSAAELAGDDGDASGTAGSLAQLHDRGLIVQLPGSPPRWSGAPPGAALERLISDHSRVAADAAAHLAELEARFQRAAAKRATSRMVEVIHGRAAIVTRFEELQRSVRYEVRSCDAPPYPQRNPAAVNALELFHLRRGIRYRVLYDRRALHVPGRLADLEAGINAGEQARVTDVPIKMTMADHAMAILPVRQPADVESRLIVYDPALLDVLGTLFDVYWEWALPLQAHHGHAQLTDAGRGPSTDEAHLLPLLVAGLTDQEIAAQLGVSDRTIRHRVHAMMRRLDATTRFQAGYQAITRGWLATGSFPAARAEQGQP